MVRIVAIALAAFAVAGCGADTVLRIDVEPGGLAPASLVVSLPQLGAPPRTIAPVTLPGTIVLHHLPSSVSQLCVEVDALDVGGNAIGGGAATVQVKRDGTASTTITLADPPVGCADVAGDLGTPLDLATGAPDDMASPPPTGPDMTAVLSCPPGAIFCDDFEGNNLTKWTDVVVKQDAGSLTVQSAIKAHGTYALKALGNGAPSPGDIYCNVEKDFTPTAPPFALRANVYTPAPLGNFDIVIALYDSTTHGFAIGGDGSNTWVVTQDQAGAADQHSDMVPTGSNQWHCVELVIDAAGKATLFVDNHAIIGPWQRASAASYSSLFVGLPRSVDQNLVSYIDDVAIGPSRLYCPP